ncbi:MAG: pseudaminic acid synthase [Clostridiales bacterium]|nr:pseudaminic acid synthase [Candidatus Equinaster intestinalis]
MNLFNRINNGQTYIIAEMSGNHAGSLEHALEIVHAAALAGADGLKIQTYTPDTLTLNSDKPEFIINGGLWDGQRLYDLYGVAGTPWEWHKPIKEECEKVGIDFFSTPFDPTSVDFLEDLGVELYKIASTEIVDTPLIEYVASKGKPMIVSCGFASVEEIQAAVDAMKAGGCKDYILLRCSAEYPADPERMNLALIPDMAKRFGCRVGLSDHSVSNLTSLVGVSLGACVIEKHFCITHERRNPDTEFSIEYADFKKLVNEIRETEKVIGKPVYEGVDAGNHRFRSLFVVKDIKAGERFSADNIRSIRPGNGISPAFYKQVLGRTALCDIESATPLTWDLISKD